MPRANLRGLIGNLGDTERVAEPGMTAKPDASLEVAETSAELPTSMTPAPPKQDRHAPDETLPPRRRMVDPVARYSDFERKETRLRADQQDALTEHARRLNRAKGVGGARITDNTLIRVAVDLLLSKTDKLAGRDETELGRSVGLKVAER
jgi:hypothetical protein